VAIGVGAFDCHFGAVGGQIEPYYLSKVMGTSTCDLMVAPLKDLDGKLIRGICGQVDGSIIPGMLGMEAGQSAFGDIYAWFKNLIAWPLQMMDREEAEKIAAKILPALEKEAMKIPVGESSVLALDWMNGRRTPDANQALKGAVLGLNLGSSAPMIYRALVEATVFGTKKIADRFTEEGIPVKGIIAMGGVAKKSPFIMQMCADVLGMPVKIVKSEQACALGAAMFAAVVGGLYKNVQQAMKKMGGGFDKTYEPVADSSRKYAVCFKQYSRYAVLAEKETMRKN
jgi:L-ribulokinase